MRAAMSEAQGTEAVMRNAAWGLPLELPTPAEPVTTAVPSAVPANAQDEAPLDVLLGTAIRTRLRIQGSYAEQRATIIEWTVFQADRLRLSRSTAYAAVHLMDRLCAIEQISLGLLRLAAATCLWIAGAFSIKLGAVWPRGRARLARGGFAVRAASR